MTLITNSSNFHLITMTKLFNLICVLTHGSMIQTPSGACTTIKRRRHLMYNFPKGLIVIEMFIQLVKPPRNFSPHSILVYFKLHSFLQSYFFVMIACIRTTTLFLPVFIKQRAKCLRNHEIYVARVSKKKQA